MDSYSSFDQINILDILLNVYKVQYAQQVYYIEYIPKIIRTTGNRELY